MSSSEPTPLGHSFPLLIKQLLISPLARHTRNEIVHEERRHDYPEFVRRIRRLSNLLVSLGVQAGDTVAVLDWDSHRYLECYFAIPSIASVLQTVNIRLSPEQIQYTLNHAGAKFLIVHRDFLPMLASIASGLSEVRSGLSEVRWVILADGDPGTLHCDLPVVGEYEALLGKASAEYEFPDFDEHTRATTFYTSGTTGRPRGVFYSHRQMVLHALGVLATFGTAVRQGRLHAEDVYMPITPLFHAHAWGIPYAATMLGLKQVYPGRYTPERLIELIKREKVTFSHCVATLLQMILDHPDSHDLDLSGVKFLIGGGALPTGLAQRALDRGADVFAGYGMSETGPVVVINHLSKEELESGFEHQADLRVRAGRPVLLSDVRTVDEEMRRLPEDGKSVGEVVLRAPWLTDGYWNDDRASEELWRGGWLHSSDIGVFDAEGVLRITDRAKDVIKSGGEWLSSLQLEGLISRCPGVREVAVIGVPDEPWGERPVALIVRDPADVCAVDRETVREHLMTFVEAGVIPKYAVPEIVVFVAELERTSVGKLDKKVLRARHGAVLRKV